MKLRIYRGRLDFTSRPAGSTHKAEIDLPPPCLAQHRDSCTPATTSPGKGQRGAHPRDQPITQRLSLSCTSSSPWPESKASHTLVMLLPPDWDPGQIGSAAVGVQHLLVLNAQPKHTATGCYRLWEALSFRGPKRFLFKITVSSLQRGWGKKDALRSSQESFEAVAVTAASAVKHE